MIHLRFYAIYLITENVVCSCAGKVTLGHLLYIFKQTVRWKENYLGLTLKLTNFGEFWICSDLPILLSTYNGFKKLWLPNFSWKSFEGTEKYIEKPFNVQILNFLLDPKAVPSFLKHILHRHQRFWCPSCEDGFELLHGQSKMLSIL